MLVWQCIIAGKYIWVFIVVVIIRYLPIQELLTSSLFKASSYFSKWQHHHPGSQTSNLEFILDTVFSLIHSYYLSLSSPSLSLSLPPPFLPPLPSLPPCQFIACHFTMQTSLKLVHYLRFSPPFKSKLPSACLACITWIASYLVFLQLLWTYYDSFSISRQSSHFEITQDIRQPTHSYPQLKPL